MKFAFAFVVVSASLVCLHGIGVHEFQMGPDQSFSNVHGQDPVKLVGLTWSNCDTGPKVINLTSLTFDPDPVILGGKITVSGAMDVLQDVGVDGKIISGDAELKMKIGDEYRDMCPLIGSKICHLDDVCFYMKVFSNRCPSFVEAQGNNCTCPIKQRTYEVKALSMILPNIPVELSGSFEVTLRLKEENKELMCVDLKFCIKECN